MTRVFLVDEVCLAYRAKLVIGNTARLATSALPSLIATVFPRRCRMAAAALIHHNHRRGEMTPRVWRAAALLLLAFCTTMLLSDAAIAAPQPASAEQTACETVADMDFSLTRDAPTQIMEAQYMEATASAPAHCLVEGYIAPAIGFGLELPAKNWNSKFIMMGCGGSCGSYRPGLEWCAEALRRGYACAATDQGHGPNLTVTPVRPALDRLWSYQNPQAKIDHAGRAMSATTIAGRAIAEKFYKAAIRLTYFLGCSDGGRSAMIMAQHYPSQFDGIVAIDPVMRWSRSLLQLEYNYQAVTHADGTPIFKRSDLELLHQAVLRACDKIDGLADGVVGDPRLCRFEPGTLECKAGATGNCLSKEQVDAARKIYAGIRTSTGKQVFYGSMPGTELDPPYGFNDVPNSRYSEYYKYMLFAPDLGPTWTREQMDPDTDYTRLGVARTLFDADNPDLREFKARGGKLMIVQGWNDSGLPSPLSNVDYYEEVQRVMGGPEKTKDFARLFMMPGAAHCGRGSGANMADYLTYLENWVEKKQAPDMLVAYHLEVGTKSWSSPQFARAPTAGDQVTFSRPIYPYPTQFRYKGKGDPNDYRSFAPVDPKPTPEVRINY
ncbi:tannase/feruloyl esterase family alpha/beta hydrolase [Sphingomonas oligophenolica]|uniref:Tannase/feruloyl esterase family alpha/beta hydrolase n=1 Tax=Sphingomonas oligophenolica TaxID=301154 RepID=A0ABU9Y695_9SPHN